MSNKIVNKNTETICDFYINRLADPKSLKNKNVCLLALGNAKYETECKMHAKSILILQGNEDPFGGIDFKDINSLKERIENWLIKNKMKKFDIIIMNPPYDGSLHLKILEAVIPFAEKTVNISPIRWLRDIGFKYKKTSDFNKYKNIREHLAISKIIDSVHARSLFDADFTFELGIYDINAKNSIFSKPLDAYDVSALFYKIIDCIRTDDNYKNLYILKYNDCLMNYVCPSYWAPESKYNKKHFAFLKTTNGPFIADYTYRKYKNACKQATRGDVANTECIVFKTAEEAMNCYNSFNCIFSQFLCCVSTVDAHVYPNIFAPFMRDYSRPWTDKRFCEYFNITGYISDNEAEPGSEWETILKYVNEMKAR